MKPQEYIETLNLHPLHLASIPDLSVKSVIKYSEEMEKHNEYMEECKRIGIKHKDLSERLRLQELLRQCRKTYTVNGSVCQITHSVVGEAQLIVDGVYRACDQHIKQQMKKTESE